MAVGRHSEEVSRLTCAFSSIPTDTKMAEHRGRVVENTVDGCWLSLAL